MFSIISLEGTVITVENVLLFLEQHVCSQQKIVWGSRPSEVLPEFLLEKLFRLCKEGIKNPVVWEEKPLKAEGDLHVPHFSWKGLVSLLLV